MAASACVNNVGVTPGKFSSYSWLSPRVSFTRDDDTGKSSSSSSKGKALKERDNLDLENDAADFEFCLDYPVDLLPAADELISDGKLMPMMPPPPQHQQQYVSVSVASKQPVAEVERRLPDTVKTRRITEVMSSGGADPFLYSPKAPRCASRWKEILGLKKLHHNSINVNNSPREKTNRSLKNLLNRNSKSSSDGPLLRDPDCESQSISSRLSLSSSSSGHELDDFPRLSLDAEKQSISLLKNNPNPPPRVRLVKLRPAENGGCRPVRRVSTDQSNTGGGTLGITVDSPRMNSSGKIVFQSLERSSSSPGSFNGGPRLKHGGMERSYSANVRVPPVLNVPVCSLSKSGSVFGFGHLFPSQLKRDSNGRSYQCISSNGGGSSSSRTRT